MKQERYVIKINLKTQKSPYPAAPTSAKQGLYSAPPGVRTLDTLIKSQVLYQLS